MHKDNTDISQKRRILGYLKMHRTITPLQALRRFGCFRLGARIWELKQDGHQISAKKMASRAGKSFCQYRLEG